MFLYDITNYDSAKLSLDELVERSALAKIITAEFGANSADVPEALVSAQKRLNIDIKQRTRDMLEKRLSEVRSRRAALATPDEKRQALADEEAKLISALG